MPSDESVLATLLPAGFHLVRGHIQPYDWGTVDGLVGWQPAAPAGSRQAELWFGDHPAGPSVLVTEPTITLDEVRSERGPLLLKILSVARPLSLQVHPDDATAAAGLTDYSRSDGAAVLVDAQGKDEMVLAITEFALFAGFRPAAVARAMLNALGGVGVDLALIYRNDGPAAAAAAAFALDSDVVTALIGRIDDVLATTGHHSATRESMAILATMYPADPAVLVAFMLQHRVLAPGEALHVAPGTPHAYLRGCALEVMTNSDNVLRLGFTSKPLAIEAALAILRTQPGEIIVGAGPSYDAVYYAGDAPFVMRKVTRDVELLESRHRMVLCLEGTAVVETEGRPVALAKGVALVGDDWTASTVRVQHESVVVIAELA